MIKVRKKIYDVVPEEAFITSEGEELKNLDELLDALNRATPEQFRKHVNEEKNDFANWIRNSVKDPELADRLEKTTDFEETKRIISDYVKFLKGEEEHGSKTTFDEIPDDLGKTSIDTTDNINKDNHGFNDNQASADDNNNDDKEDAKPLQGKTQTREIDNDSISMQEQPDKKNIDDIKKLQKLLEFKEPSAAEKQKYLLSKKEALHNFLIGSIVGFFAGAAVGFIVSSLI